MSLLRLYHLSSFTQFKPMLSPSLSLPFTMSLSHQHFPTSFFMPLPPPTTLFLSTLPLHSLHSSMPPSLQPSLISLLPSCRPVEPDCMHSGSHWTWWTAGDTDFHYDSVCLCVSVGVCAYLMKLGRGNLSSKSVKRHQRETFVEEMKKHCGL